MGTRRRERKRPPSIAAHILIAVVRMYQLTFGLLARGHCRFTPSCVHYAIAALHDVGAWRGTLYTIIRLWRCNLMHSGGFDPPPRPR